MQKQGIFANNKGFSTRKPAVSFESAFCINDFFAPAYTPADGITLYYWNEADCDAAVYSDGTTTWTSGVQSYSIGAYCKIQAAKGGAIADRQGNSCLRLPCQNLLRLILPMILQL